MTSATFARVELVVVLRPIPIDAPLKLVATIVPVSVSSPLVLLIALPSLARTLEVIAALLPIRLFAPL